MIKELTYKDDCVFVHAAETSLKTTKAFTHGRIVFDESTRLATFAQLPAVAIPAELHLKAETPMNFQLVAPDGELRPQKRSGVLLVDEKQPTIFHIGGMSKTPRQFSAEDGWTNNIYKYRAYFTHEGTNTSGEVPEWLRASIKRQRDLWNRLAWLCREARRQCSSGSPEEITTFVETVILPAIDAFNDALGRSKDKMKHPAKLKVEMPGLDGLWHFVGDLRKRVDKDRPVPEGLLEKVIDFSQQHKTDYTPLDAFVKDFGAIANKEAKDLGLRSFEVRPTVTAFKATLDRRRTKKLTWSEGWPLIKYNDSPKAGDWGLHYYFNKAGVNSSLLESKEGVPGLSFGAPLDPANTGHKLIHTASGGKTLREAEISIRGDDNQQWRFRFAVIQWRPLPPNSHVKEWKLLLQDGKLWLCLVVELQRDLPTSTALAAGLDVGWRRTEVGIRFGTLYEPTSWTVRELVMDFEQSPKDHKDRVPFRFDMGPTRWEKRNITRLFPDWKPGDGIPNALEIRTALQTRRDYFKDTAKILLRKHLGEKTPAWLEKAGRSGLLRLKEEFKDDVDVQGILNTWGKNEEEIGTLAAAYSKKVTTRIEYNQLQIAHDVCRYLKQKGITRLILEKNFLAKIALHQENTDPVSLKRSQKYRQFAAVGRFISLLKYTAVKYGIVTEPYEAMNTTRMCQYCNHLNPSTEKDRFQCEACGRTIDQDYNAAVNLSRFACDPKLAKLALGNGNESEEDAQTPEFEDEEEDTQSLESDESGTNDL